MIFAALAVAAAPFLLLQTDAHGRDITVRYASEAACERARQIASRVQDRQIEAERRQRRNPGHYVWVVGPSCIPATR